MTAQLSNAQSISTESVYRVVLADARCSGRGVAGVRGSVPVIRRERYWAAFFSRFPSASAHVELSPVAFDVAAREALVYCGYSVSPFGGEGSIVHLRLTNGTWTPIAWHQVWIS